MSQAEIFPDSFNMENSDGFLAGMTLEEGHIIGVVHKEVFGEDYRAEGVAQDIEAGFKVGIIVGVVGAKALAWKVFRSCGVKTGCQSIGTGVSF